MTAVQSENEFLKSRVNALSELEGEILEENQVQGVIVATDDVEVMKKAVAAHMHPVCGKVCCLRWRIG